MSAPENPQAFPVSTIDGFTNQCMTLRDWFAGQALSAIARSDISSSGVRAGTAQWAYAMADAMLAARKGAAS